MSTCGNCKHWERPEDRTGWVGFLGAESGITDWSDEAMRAREAQVHEAERLIGWCKRPAFFPPPSEVLAAEGPQMLVADGSEYRADLYTTADFGCALWEAS